MGTCAAAGSPDFPPGLLSADSEDPDGGLETPQPMGHTAIGRHACAGVELRGTAELRTCSTHTGQQMLRVRSAAAQAPSCGSNQREHLLAERNETSPVWILFLRNSNYQKAPPAGGLSPLGGMDHGTVMARAHVEFGQVREPHQP